MDTAHRIFFCWILKAICLISRRRRLKEFLNVQSTIERPKAFALGSAAFGVVTEKELETRKQQLEKIQNGINALTKELTSISLL